MADTSSNVVERKATHAGSWYEESCTKLETQLRQWLSEAKTPDTQNPYIGLIVPHAGYAYSASTAAWGYKALVSAAPKIKRIVILGPAHHAPLRTCALSQATVFKTPCGNVPVDTESVRSLQGPVFSLLDAKTDAEEHSIEMQLPWIALIMKEHSTTFRGIVPVLVGSPNVEQETACAKRLATLLSPETFWIVSSDFCHWGKRFGFHYYKPSDGPVYASIEALDRAGMRAISSGSADRFSAYQEETSNTICGRRAITILLRLLTALDVPPRIEFVAYHQSNKSQTLEDASVSYATAIVTGR